MKKIRPSHKYTYLTFLIIFMMLTFLLWAIFGTKSWSYQGDYLKERLWVELTYILISAALSVTGALIYRMKVYYMVDEEKIIRHGKDFKEYYFKNIVYIDEEYLKNHQDTYLYLDTGKWINLTFDSKKELYQLIKKKSPLLTKDQLDFKYPDAIADKNKLSKKR